MFHYYMLIKALQKRISQILGKLMAHVTVNFMKTLRGSKFKGIKI